MKYPFRKIKIKSDFLLPFDLEIKKKKRGEILHFVLSLITFKEDFEYLEDLLERAFINFMEKPSNWEIEKDFLIPLKNLASKDFVETIFPSKVKNSSLKIYKEQDIVAGTTLFRPDRIIVDEKEVLVIDFKTHFYHSSEEFISLHKKQLEGYKKLLEKIFPEKHVSGALLYLEPIKLITLKT